ncbi:hypothetical protein M408DRAFT_30753 [Serendipita vermifera MAFF 305830]|uniref:Uncharacterized protein n=1 Tax=Serendipita vermifera MAFF 305830 TaxID=933852 RepID=A0A0C2W0D2_SERVB|nr:hypothetical protein M408DRAFT_30753 [Serendipita vermifera MAFF 305830]
MSEKCEFSQEEVVEDQNVASVWPVLRPDGGGAAEDVEQLNKGLHAGFSDRDAARYLLAIIESVYVKEGY